MTHAQLELQAFLNRLKQPDTGWKRCPPGITVIRRRAKRGKLYDRAAFCIASKGRTGASVRQALQEYLRHGPAPLLHKDWPA